MTGLREGPAVTGAATLTRPPVPPTPAAWAVGDSAIVDHTTSKFHGMPVRISDTRVYITLEDGSEHSTQLAWLRRPEE